MWPAGSNRGPLLDQALRFSYWGDMEMLFWLDLWRPGLGRDAVRLAFNDADDQNRHRVSGWKPAVMRSVCR